MEPILKIGRLHEIKKEREVLKKKLEDLIRPYKEELTALDLEEQSIREFLENEALKKGEKKSTKNGVKASLSYNGLGSVAVTEKDDWVITNKDEALEITKENPVFFEAQKISLDNKKFLEIALDIYQSTGDLVSCVSKEKKRSTRITLAKLEPDEESLPL